MKALIWVIFIAICLFSCREKRTQININCSECAGIEVSLTNFSILRGIPKIDYHSNFDSLGKVSIQLLQYDTLNLLLVVGGEDQPEKKFSTVLYLEPGSKVSLVIKNGSPTFRGDLEIVNSYYAKIFMVQRKRIEYVNLNLIKHVNASSLEKQTYLDGLKRFGIELNQQIKEDNSISNYYKQMLLNYSLLYEITERIYFETQVAISDINTKGASVVLDSALSNAFDDLNINKDFINTSYYISYLRGRLKPIFLDLLDYYEKSKIETGEYEYIKRAIGKNPKLIDYTELILALYITHVSNADLMDYDIGLTLIHLFQKDYPHSKYIPELSGMLAGYNELRNGMPMKDFEMYGINGKAFRLSNLKGNIVYIDVWATWCGPCREELKYSVKLSRKYSNHPDLKFLYISMDSDIESWKKFLRNNVRLKGVHGIQYSELLSDSNNVASLYKINAIPRYILIDKDGKIINTTAASPSQLLNNRYLDSLLAR